MWKLFNSKKADQMIIKEELAFLKQIKKEQAYYTLSLFEGKFIIYSSILNFKISTSHRNECFVFYGKFMIIENKGRFLITGKKTDAKLHLKVKGNDLDIDAPVDFLITEVNIENSLFYGENEMYKVNIVPYKPTLLEKIINF